MTSHSSQNGFLSEKCFLIQILPNLHKCTKVISRKKDDSAHPNILFNDIPVESASHQKQLGIYLDKK